MKDLVVNIAGVPTKLISKKVPLNSLILDQDNPRIGLFKDTQLKPDINQEEIEYAIIHKNPKAFEKLKENIRSNEGIVNPIWICSEKDKYIIVEGNTRAVIYKQLNNEFPNKEEYHKILSFILPSHFNEEKRDFIRLQAHLRGTTPWDSYERARYLYLLNDGQGYSIKRLATLTKLSPAEIEQSIKAFTDMEEEYLPKYKGDPTEVFKYSYFVEFEKDKKLQEIMRKNSLDLGNFCNWVGTGKIKRAMDVRDLRHILENQNIKDLFIKKGFDEAMQELAILKPQFSSTLYDNMRKVIDGLKKLQSHEITEMKEGLQPGRVELIKELKESSQIILELI